MQGRVPKNEYGNIELFQPSMLPKGALHMTGSIDQSLYHTLTGSYAVPGIARVARKLEIDHAPAMMGWDFHSRGGRTRSRAPKIADSAFC